MELNNQCLHAFWAWYLLPENKKNYKTGSLFGKDNAIKVRFLAMSFTERYGVYVDFFDSVGIYPQISFYDFDSNNWQIFIECNKSEFDYSETHFVSRQEARKEAIKKANEIYNMQ